jgi:uncharacterized protein (TIGR02147 family)
MEKNTLPSIFNYIDFRKFLADYYVSRHAIDKKFTKSFFCKKINIPNTRGYLNEIIQDRHVSKDYAHRIAQALEFNEDELKYFLVLVDYCQATQEKERELHFEHLISLNRSPKKVLDMNAFILYKDWYHSVIRAVLDIFEFKDDYNALSKRLIPPITPGEAKNSIKLLSSLGLIQKDKEGVWKPTDKAISTPAYVQDELVVTYQLNLLESAKRIILDNRSHPENIPTHTITTNTISISDEGFDRLQKKFEKFRSEIRSLIVKDEKPAQRVYQMNIQLFPATR